jgi:hypothetical protein
MESEHIVVGVATGLVLGLPSWTLWWVSLQYFWLNLLPTSASKNCLRIQLLIIHYKEVKNLVAGERETTVLPGRGHWWR